MPTSCLNCGALLNDNYCSHCGQKAGVKRLSWHSLGEEVFHFFTHIEKGFLKTTGQLITHPGTLFKNYLDGKRKTYHKPISFLLIWIGLFLVVFHLVKKLTHFENSNTSTLLTNEAAIAAIIAKYRSLIEILILPFTAFSTWLIIARPKLNYVEVLSVTFYTFSFLFILLIAQFIIAFVVGINFRTNAFDITTTGIFIAWSFYAGYEFYKKYAVAYIVPRLVLSLSTGAIVYFFLSKVIARMFIAWQF
ncbi:MAG: DUF3667 domain-containing protein [Ferruginibacter sp.]|nr:DUF3667 domain-containing protein [Chitinophagaceae bacterium]